MPFTLAHPALVLPVLRSRHVSATGLIIGSMTPDVEYFLTMSDQCNNSHTLMSVFNSYLPLTLILSLIFHVFIRRSLMDNLPAFFQQRYGGIRSFHFLNYLRRHWFVFLYSAAAGIALHFGWDSMTHGTGVFAYFIPFYSHRFLIWGNDYSMMIVLQYASTLLGMSPVIYYLFKYDAKRIVSVHKVSAPYWIAIDVIVSAVMWIRVDLIKDAITHRSLLISLVSSFFIGLWLSGKWHRIYSLLRIYRIGRLFSAYDWSTGTVARQVYHTARTIREEIPYYVKGNGQKWAEKQL